MEEGPELPAPPGVRQCEPCGPRPLGVHGGVIAQARLIKSLTISDWTDISSPSPLPEVVRGGLKFPTSDRLVGSAGNRPHPQER